MEPAKPLGHGVPFRFPAMVILVRALVRMVKTVQYCDDNGILIDLSHRNEAGFWDIAKQSSAPLVATHSNAYAISPHARNLQTALKAIAESDVMVGLPQVAFLRPDGRMQADTGFDVLLAIPIICLPI